MLLLQRKQRQKLTGKIGHSDAEYEVGHGGDAGVLQGIAGPKRSPVRPRGAMPHVNQQEPPYQQPSPPLIPSNVPPMNVSPWRGNIPYVDGHSGCAQPISFPSVLPPISAAPLIPAILPLNKSPMRFPHALDSKFNLPLYTAWPSPFCAQPIAQQAPVLSSSPTPVLPPIPVNRIQNYGRHPESERTPAAVHPTVVPCRAEVDEVSAHRLARQRAIEIQNENARLSEERRRLRELEKQREVEEERRLQSLAQEEAIQAKLEKEREKYAARRVPIIDEQSETEERVRMMGRKAAQAERRRAESEERVKTLEYAGVGPTMSRGARPSSAVSPIGGETRKNAAIGTGISAAESMSQDGNDVYGRGSSNGLFGSTDIQSPRSGTLPQAAPSVPQSLDAAYDDGSSYIPQPLPFTLEPIQFGDPLRDVHALPTFGLGQPPSFPNKTVETGTTVPDFVDWSPPLVALPDRQLSLSSDATAQRLEAQLQDIVTTHNVIHHVLADDTRDTHYTSPSYRPPPPMFPHPTSADPLRPSSPVSVGSKHVLHTSPTAGVLKHSPERPMHSSVEVIGVKRSQHKSGATAAAAAVESEGVFNREWKSAEKAPALIETTSDDLSAEPSIFVTAVRMGKR